MADLANARVLILAADGFEESELFDPRQALLDAGAQVTLASIKTDPIQGVVNDSEKARTITPAKLPEAPATPTPDGKLPIEVRDEFGGECLPINLPAKGGTGVVDCFFHLCEHKRVLKHNKMSLEYLRLFLSGSLFKLRHK